MLATANLRGVLLALVGVLCLLPGSAVAQLPSPAHRKAIGYLDLERRLRRQGRPMPSGRGVTLTQVESHGSKPDDPESDLRRRNIRYLPDFNHPDFENVRFTDPRELSNPAGESSPHATSMGRNIYGAQGMAPGIQVVDTHYTDDWLFLGGLRTGSAGQLPLPSAGRLQNHSWVATMETRVAGVPVNFNEEILQRFDFMVQRDGVVAVVGRTDRRHPLMGTAYNAISVGLATGSADRPMIVAPAPSASLATAWVTAAAALLLETADNLPDTSARNDAARSETIRAVLLAGASKAMLQGKYRWTRSASEPLSTRYGAGQLNIDDSHRILEAGPHAALDAALVPPTGWDLAEVTPQQPRHYFFEVPADRPEDELSVIATWNRQVDLGKLRATCANVDLRLLHADAECNVQEVVADGADDDRGESLARSGNVEHLYFESLPPGRYAIEVTTDQPWQVALAWDLRPPRHPSLVDVALTRFTGPNRLIASLIALAAVTLAGATMTYVITRRRKRARGEESLHTRK